MSQEQISRSNDLQRLQDHGYEIEIRSSGHLLVHAIPYVNAKCEIAYGTLVSPLDLAGEVTAPPTNHVAWFIGDHPCSKDGAPLLGIKHGSNTEKFAENLEVHHSFSNKPPNGYPDYFAKMTRYIEIMSHHARSIDPSVTAQTYKPIVTSEAESVFLYTDSASSRAGIAGLATKLAMQKVAIVGLGGTGSYILDLLAKTPVREIHLYDGDYFLQHNAFRSPGAPSLDDLLTRPFKTSYLIGIYGKMRRGLKEHQSYVTEDNVAELTDFDFVFICVDKASVRKLISEALAASQVPFIDVGMDVQLIKEEQCLIGSCRTTTSTPSKRDHFTRRVPLQDDAANEVYASNIQIADMNALNATLAVIKWKKYCGFYQDLMNEHESVYAINAHQLTKDEKL